MEPFTDETVFAVGGWDRRFTRVLGTVVVGDAAVALTDPNGINEPSGIEEMDFYALEPDQGWQYLGGGSAGTSGWSSSNGLLYACGQSSKSEVTLAFWGEAVRVAVGANGWWLFAAPADDLEEIHVIDAD